MQGLNLKRHVLKKLCFQILKAIFLFPLILQNLAIVHEKNSEIDIVIDDTLRLKYSGFSERGSS
jgi:hypothetical protein